jgi:hypothetical protein
MMDGVRGGVLARLVFGVRGGVLACLVFWRYIPLFWFFFPFFFFLGACRIFLQDPARGGVSLVSR